MSTRIFASIVIGVELWIVLLGALMGLSAPVQASSQLGQGAEHLFVPHIQGSALLPPVLTPNYDGFARPGGLVSRRFNLANGNNVTDTLHMQASSEHGWAVVVGDGPELGPFEAADVYALVAVPSDADVGTVDRTMITATSEVSPALWTTAMITLVVRSPVDIAIEPSKHKESLPNQVISFTHVLTNEGADTVFVLFEAASALDWQVEPQPSFSLLDADETATLKIDTALPATAAPGLTAEIVVTVTAHSPTTVSQPVVIDTVTIQGSRIFLPVVLKRS